MFLRSSDSNLLVSHALKDEMIRVIRGKSSIDRDMIQQLLDENQAAIQAAQDALTAAQNKLEEMPNNLSGGQQQRVAIARALITKPAIVLADEPTGNLDSKTSAEVLGLIKRTSAEFRQTVVMITHIDDIARLADRIVRIEDGRIVE